MKLWRHETRFAKCYPLTASLSVSLLAAVIVRALT